MQSSMSLEIVGGDDVARQVRLRALLPEGKLVFASKALDLGGIPVGVPQTSVVTLKNTGLHDAMFQVGSLYAVPSASSHNLLMHIHMCSSLVQCSHPVCKNVF